MRRFLKAATLVALLAVVGCSPSNTEVAPPTAPSSAPAIVASASVSPTAAPLTADAKHGFVFVHFFAPW